MTTISEKQKYYCDEKNNLSKKMLFNQSWGFIVRDFLLQIKRNNDECQKRIMTIQLYEYLMSDLFWVTEIGSFRDMVIKKSVEILKPKSGLDIYQKEKVRNLQEIVTPGLYYCKSFTSKKIRCSKKVKYVNSRCCIHDKSIKIIKKKVFKDTNLAKEMVDIISNYYN